MRRAILPICLLLVAASVAARAQQQEEGLMDRIDGNWKKAMNAMDASAKGDKTLASSFSTKTFNTAAVPLKAYNTATFGGVKSADIKTFETRSFLGVKNPWFGKKVFDTYASSAMTRSASESSKQFQTEAFTVRDYDKGSRKDIVDAGTALPSAAQPRPYLVAPKAPGVMDRFTENLHKDLTIDDVRDLLNKGKGE